MTQAEETWSDDAPRRARKRLPCAARAAAALLLLFAPSVRAQGGDSVDLSRDFPTLAPRARTQQSAQYVIVVDYSDSMKDFWGDVRGAVMSFLDSVPDGDYVSFVTFGEGVGGPTPRPINGDTRAALKKEVEGLGDPKQQFTDLGEGVEKALDELNMPNGSRLKFVFILSDFSNFPSPGSRYKVATPQSEPWVKLAERRRNEQAANIVQAYGLLLPMGKKVGEHFDVVKAVFPDMERLAVSKDTLRPWFERRKAEIQRDKLRAAVELDAGRAPFEVREVRQSGDRLVAVVEFAPGRIVDTRAVYDLKVEGLDAGSLGPLLRPSEAPPGRLLPPEGEPRTAELPLARVGGRSSLVGWSKGDRVSFSATARQDLEPADELRRMNLDAQPRFAFAAKDVPVTLSGGWVPLWALLAAAAVLALVGYGLFQFLRPEYIVGEIGVAGEGAPVVIRRGQRLKSFEVGQTDGEKGLPVKVSGRPPKWTLAFESFQPLQRERGVYVKVLNGEGTLVRRKRGGDEEVAVSDQKWERIPRGSTVRIGGKTISFD
ncbi:MAG TPA: vWA domain-containing protein [Pyrinomonadaceae bacterium]|jgi:hypothetical protein